MGIKVKDVLTAVVIFMGTVGVYIFVEKEPTVMALVCLGCSVGTITIISAWLGRNWGERTVKRIGRLVMYVIILIGTVGSYFFVEKEPTVMGVVCVLCSMVTGLLVAVWVCQHWDDYIIEP